MAVLKLFQYAILWHPTDKQVEDEDLKSKVIVPPKNVLCEDQQEAGMVAVMDIPEEYKNQLGQIEIALHPF